MKTILRTKLIGDIEDEFFDNIPLQSGDIIEVEDAWYQIDTIVYFPKKGERVIHLIKMYNNVY